MKQGFILFLIFFEAKSYALEITSANLRKLLLEGNARVSASQMQIEASKEREGYLSRSFFPDIKLTASQEHFKTGNQAEKDQPTYGVVGEINLYNGGRDRLESSIRNLNTQKMTVEKDQVAFGELQKLRSTYWEILYLKMKKDLIQTAVEINKSNQQAAERRIQSGVATQTDRVEFEMEAINLERELQETSMMYMNHVNMILVLLNLEPGEKLDFPEELTHEHDIDAMKKFSGDDFSFAFKNIELGSKMNFLAADKEKRTIWPQVDAFASYNQFNQREKEEYRFREDRDEFAIGLKLTIDVPAGLESNRNAASYRYQADSAQTLAAIQKREVATHLQNEVNELSFLHDQVHNAEENTKYAEKYYRLTQSEYNRGVKNSPDVLGASRRLFEARHKRLEIVRNFQLSKGHILSQVGK
jgi:outer membrane protein